MADKLSIFNEALRVLASRRIQALDDGVKSRRTLDGIWDEGGEAGGMLLRCLDEGYWNFAIRTQKLEYDTDIEPEFGFRQAIKIPDDYVKLVQLSADEYFVNPERQYMTEAGYWYCSQTTIYARYVSKGSTYGFNLGKFPPNFTRYVACYLAAEAAPTIAKGMIEIAEAKLKRARTVARSSDAMEDPSKEPTQGSWTRARLSGGSGGRRDSGSRHNLIG